MSGNEFLGVGRAGVDTAVIFGEVRTGLKVQLLGAGEVWGHSGRQGTV